MQDSREEGWILKKENKEERGGDEGRGMEWRKMETVGWMAWREEGDYNSRHNTSQDGRRAEPGRRSQSRSVDITDSGTAADICGVAWRTKIERRAKPSIHSPLNLTHSPKCESN